MPTSHPPHRKQLIARHESDSAIWDQHFLVLDTFGRFFLANLPIKNDIQEACNDWPKLQRALHHMVDTTFFDFCEDVQEEMMRRNNELRDGLFYLPAYDNLSLGRNQTRQKLSTVSPHRYHSLCLQICLEIERRSSRSRLERYNRRKISIPLLESSSNASLASTMTHLDNYYDFRMELPNLLDNCHSLDPVFSDYDLRGFSFPDTPYDHFDATISAIHSVIISILQDKKRYETLLSYRGHTAQQVLDLFQMLLDYPKATVPLKSVLLSALLRLSFKAGLHPRAFILTGIKRGQEPVTSGNFGEIWKGDFHGQPVCLKILKMYQNQNTKRERLLRAFSKEAILWGHVSHPNLLPFYGIFHLDDEHGRTCLVSPWMHHGNIIEYLENKPSASRLLLALDIAEGLSYLHGRDIVHGDLKGANILVTNSGRACVSDFGLSTVLETAMSSSSYSTSSDYNGGTIRWQAPEFLDPSIEYLQASVDADVYAFSCVCYELFTGRLPFYQISREVAVMYHIMQGGRPTRPDPLDPAFMERDLTDDLWTLMESCWSKTPSNRPSMSQIVAQLKLSDTVDLRPTDDWEELSASRFRNVVYKSDCLSTSVLETVLSWM